MALIHREVAVVLNAYLLAAIPIVFVAMAGVMSPLYRQPWQLLVRWWSWMALVVVASAFLLFVLLG